MHLLLIEKVAAATSVGELASQSKEALGAGSLLYDPPGNDAPGSDAGAVSMTIFGALRDAAGALIGHQNLQLDVLLGIGALSRVPRRVVQRELAVLAES
ncbi:ROK family protein [Babesia caballi]|uniref:ROK family protein n=1 Tax=Babesia caballi TaxID=5871 RepID=A0AAV4LN17_BABCB|nr:ROK family protein [Babesia caballi]